MAWTSPMTAVSGSVFTAAQFNTNVRDNFLQTGPALITAANQILVGTAANAMAARQFTSGYIATQETTTGSFPINLATFGPWVSVNTGTMCMCAIYTQMYNSSNSAACYSGFEVTNATTIPCSWDRAIGGITNTNPGFLAGATFLQTGLTPGTNQFTMQYGVSAGTGTFLSRRIFTMPL